MATTLKAKLLTAASATAGLTTLLGTAPFRWWDRQLLQGSAMPAVVVTQVSGTFRYSFSQRDRIPQKRVQFTIWANSGEQASSVRNALAAFLDSFTAVETGTLPRGPNEIVNERDGMYVDTQPPLYQQTLDAMIYDNELI